MPDRPVDKWHLVSDDPGARDALQQIGMAARAAAVALQSLKTATDELTAVMDDPDDPAAA